MKKLKGKSNRNYNAIMKEREEYFKKGQKPIIGIDIGNNSIKMVQIKKNNKIKFGMQQVPGGMINQGRIETPDQLAEIIKKIVKYNKIKGNKCSLCLSCSELIVRELRIPEMTDDQIMGNIRNEITSLLPLNHEEYSTDYKVLEYIESNEGTPGKLRLMVVAVPKSIVQTYTNALKKAKLKLVYIDVIPNIAEKLIRWAALNPFLANKFSNVGIIDFGAHTTNITLLHNGVYNIHKTINNGGDYLTSLIAEKLNIDIMEAEKIKKNVNIFEINEQNIAIQYMKNFIDYLLTDIERTIEYYKNRNNQKGPEQIYIMGGGSLLKGLAQYMKDHLYVEVTLFSDLLLHYKKGNDLGDKIVSFSNAIGATLREE